MAPVELPEKHLDLVPLLLTAGVTLAASASLLSIGRSFFKLRKALPVSSRTRSHETQRRRNVIVFVVLAAISLAINLYNTIELFVDSYTHFIVANRVIPETDIWTSPIWLPQYKDLKSLQLGTWLNSEDLMYLVESLFSSPRDFWWFQQLQSAGVVWVLFLAVQGRRHKIPHTWAYLLLSGVVGLAVPVNLLFIALLLTPVPFERVKPIKRSRALVFNSFEKFGHRLKLTRAHDRAPTWAPNPVIPTTLVLLAVFCQFATPYVGAQSYRIWVPFFPNVAAVAMFLVEYTGVLPASFGKTYRTVHEAHASYKATFRIASISAFALHIVSTVHAISANVPPLYRPRFHLLDTAGDTVSSTSSSYFHAVARTLGAFSDSPLVQLIGWDVLLTGLSIVVWAGIRGLHPTYLISSIGLPVEADAAKTEPLKRTAKRVVENGKSAAAAAETRIRSALDEDSDEPPITRSHKPKTASTSPAATSSRRGRPSRAQLQRAAEDAAQDPDGEDEDPTYHPSADVSETVEHDEHAETADASEQAESGAVAWGVLVLGGLGMGMASVCGAEVI